MRVVHQTVVLYKFSELSEQAKQNAISNWRDVTAQSGAYAWYSEWIDSLKEFTNRLGITLNNYSISPYGYSNIDWSLQSDNWVLEDLKGLRLRTWLINNWMDSLTDRKFLGHTKKRYDSIPFYHRMVKWVKINRGDDAGKYYGVYSSNIHKDTDHTLTGFCGDYSLTKPLEDFINSGDKYLDLEDVINICFDSFVKDFNADMEFQDSEEYIAETIECNEYDFNFDGDMI